MQIYVTLKFKYFHKESGVLQKLMEDYPLLYIKVVTIQNVINYIDSTFIINEGKSLLEYTRTIVYIDYVRYSIKFKH
jgi:hypothetical protein